MQKIKKVWNHTKIWVKLMPALCYDSFTFLKLVRTHLRCSRKELFWKKCSLVLRQNPYKIPAKDIILSDIACLRNNTSKQVFFKEFDPTLLNIFSQEHISVAAFVRYYPLKYVKAKILKGNSIRSFSIFLSLSMLS